MNRREAEAFLYAEARLLDDNDLQGWLDLTAEDFTYWIPVNDSQSDPKRHLSIVYDNKEQCAERIFRIRDSGLNHTQDPASSTMRFVTNVEVQPRDESNVAIRCNTLLYEYRSSVARRDSVKPNIHPARCEYDLRRLSSRWELVRKKMVFAHLDGPLDAMCFFI